MSGTSPLTITAEHEISQGRTRAAILDAARDILDEGGLDALSMREVAERISLSATAIYHYFDGKSALVAAVVRQGFERFGAYLEAAMRQHPKGSIERLTALGESYVRFAFENQPYFRLLFTIQTDLPRDMADLPEGGGYHLLRQCVVEAMDSGAIPRGNPDLVVHFLWFTVHGLITLRMAFEVNGSNADDCPAAKADVPATPVELFRAIAPLVIDGMRGQPSPPPSTQESSHV